jgi:single-strand DNA-binding protein
MNVVALIGNLTRDPELRHTPAGTPVLKMRVAVNSRTKTGDTWGDKPNYFDVIVWGAQGENASRFLSKGRRVGITGRLDWREWEAQDGSKRQAIEIVADSVQFLTPRQDGDSGGSRQFQEPSEPEPYRSTAGADEPYAGDDDIPF